MPITPVEQLNRAILNTEVKLDRLRRMRDLITEDPSLATEILDSFVNDDSMPPTTTARLRQPGMTQIMRIQSFLLSKGNEWQTVREIMEGTDLTRNSINALLYSEKHGAHFEHKQLSEHRKVWRVKNADATR